MHILGQRIQQFVFSRIITPKQIIYSKLKSEFGGERKSTKTLKHPQTYVGCSSPPGVTEKFSGPSSGAETRSSRRGCSKGP